MSGAFDRDGVPDGIRVYAVGDIHGRADLAAKIVTMIAQDNAERKPAQTKLVFLGDYIDRGPDSKGVIDCLLTQLPGEFEPFFLKGNHEQMLMDFSRDVSSARTWLMNGGDAALLSYGVEAATIDAASSRWRKGVEVAQNEFSTLLSAEHREFYKNLRLSVHIGGYFFVHGGVRPGVALELQDEDDMLWIRNEFLGWQGDFGAVVVHGHTPVASPENYINRIGIDTYAFKTGRLTAVGLEDRDRWFLST